MMRHANRLERARVPLSRSATAFGANEDVGHVW